MRTTARIDHCTDSRDARPAFGITYRRYVDTSSSHVRIQADNIDHAMQALTEYIGNTQYAVTSIRQEVPQVPAVAPAAEPAPAEVYVKATAGYAARFEGLTGDSLRALETIHGSEAPTDRITPLLDTLAAWKQHLDRFEATVTDADEKTVEGLPEDDPRRVAWRAASTGMDAFLKAQAAVHGAYVDWSFDLTGTVEINDGPLPTAPVIADGCRIPGCDQHWHSDGLCVAQLGELPFDEGSSVPIELTSPEDEAPYIVAYAFDPVALNMRRQMNTQADAVAFAKALRDAADAVDEAAAHLAA
ncbi:hypothetical protein ACH4N4_19330 [Streptomyces microflavus]|uniref:hypothetical protein n=1 Tax=Streptomyces microflavus TaxID=1919 RepID=UPI0037AD28D0